MVPSGSAVQQHTFSNWIKTTELQPLTRGAKMCSVRKNDRNLPITSPNFNIFQWD